MITWPQWVPLVMVWSEKTTASKAPVCSHQLLVNHEVEQTKRAYQKNKSPNHHRSAALSISPPFPSLSPGVIPKSLTRSWSLDLFEVAIEEIQSASVFFDLSLQALLSFLGFCGSSIDASKHQSTDQEFCILKPFEAQRSRHSWNPATEAF